MLVLTRKLGERILVPECALELTVLAVQGNTVRLGISAPREIAIHRGELQRQGRRQPTSEKTSSA
jgi:carbon storage regulator